MQTDAPTSPTSADPEKNGTPFGLCTAGASAWYVVLILALIILAQKPQYGLGGVLPLLVIGTALWALTSIVTWLIFRKVRLRLWALIPLTAPIYVLVGVVIAALMSPIMNLYVTLMN